jgi:hypothetical protein
MKYIAILILVGAAYALIRHIRRRKDAEGSSGGGHPPGPIKPPDQN